MISNNVKPFCVGCELPDNAHVPGRGQRKCYGRRIMLERDIGREVNFTLLPTDEYRYRVDIGDRFIAGILGSKHVLLFEGGAAPVAEAV